MNRRPRKRKALKLCMHCERLRISCHLSTAADRIPVPQIREPPPASPDHPATRDPPADDRAFFTGFLAPEGTITTGHFAIFSTRLAVPPTMSS